MNIFEALEKTAFNVELSCKLAKMQLVTFYLFMQMDEDFKRRVEAIEEKFKEEAKNN